MFRRWPVVQAWCRMAIGLLFSGLISSFAGQVGAAADTVATVRLGILPFGTLNWEIQAAQSAGLDRKHRVTLETVPLANAEAGKVALLGHRVDMIVSDWIWVATQREQHRDLQFHPYSTAQGALMVPAGSSIRQVGDLAHRKLGVAGGALDKNWLLLKALVQKTTGQQLEQITTPVFAAPPLLNQQISQGRLDAVLNYWNFSAKLEGQGYRTVLDGATVLQGLGFTAPIPSLGYVFSESWANREASGVNRLFAALREARDKLCESDESWNRVASLSGETDPRVQHSLRVRYCAGRIQHFGDTEKTAIQSLYAMLHQLGEGRATGLSPVLPTGIFWTGGQ